METRQLNNEEYNESADNREDCKSIDNPIVVSSQPETPVRKSKAHKPGRKLAIGGLTLTFITPLPFLASILGVIFTFVASVALRIMSLVPFAYLKEWTAVMIMLISPIIDLLIASGAILIPFYICVVLLIAALSLSITALVKKCKLGIAGIVMSVISIVAVFLIAVTVILTAIIIVSWLFMIFMFA